LRQFGRRFQYRINRIFARASWVPFALLAVTASAVALLGSNARFLGLFSPQSLEADGIRDDLGGGIGDGLFWSLKHVIDPGAFGENYGAPVSVTLIALVLSIVGLVILGILIGFITNLVQRRVEALERGNTPVFERGHTLLLGWSKKIYSVLRELARLRPGAVVVILAPREISAMREELRAEGLMELPIDIVLRSGRSDAKAELQRVAVESADSIIVLSPDRGGGASSAADVEAIKTLMLISSFEDWEGEPARVVGEIGEDRNYEIATIASRERVPVVSSTQYISRLLVQSARFPGLSDVYRELLGAKGGSIHVKRLPQAVGKSFGEVALRLEGAIPIGITWDVPDGGRSRTAAALNPEPSYEIDEDESLVLLSPAGRFQWNPKPAPRSDLGTGVAGGDAAVPRRVLILGRGHMIDEIVRELDGHVTEATEVCIASDTGAEDGAMQLDRETLKHLDLRFRRANTGIRAGLEALDVASFDTVFVLADTAPGVVDPDARTILSLLLLGDLRRRAGTRWPRVVAEIYDPRNRDLLSDTSAGDLIVTPEVTSVLMTQISQLPVLAPVYRELLSAGGIEIGLRAISSYAPLDSPCRFGDLVSACQNRLEIALGVRRHAVSELLMNPSKSASWTFSEGDQIVVLAQQRYE
jgi:hypothetical protein